MGESSESYVAENISISRWDTAEKIADSMVCRASDRSPFMTGDVPVIDGG